MTATSFNTPFPLGADIYNPDAWNAANETLFQTTYNNFVSVMGVPPQFINSAVDYRQPISGWIGSASEQAQSQAAAASARNMTPVIGMPMFSTAAGSGTIDQQLKAFAAGQNDSVIQGVVQAYTQQGYHDLNFRLGWEMNLSGTPTYVGSDPQTQADWVAAFQHIYTVLHQAAAANGATAQVMWNPGTTNYSNASATTSLYPGNNFVDIIGADVYSDMAPYTDANGLYHDWATGGEDSLAQFMANPVNRAHYWTYPAANMWTNDGSNGHSLSFDSLLQFAQQQGKPFAVAEAGAGNSSAGGDVTDDSTFPQWLSAQLTAAQSAGEKIAFVNLWDSNYGGNYEFTAASDNKPLEAAAWAKYFGAQPGTTPPTLVPPVIGGTRAAVTTTDRMAVKPLSTVVITDPTAGQTETVTVTLSSPANGSLSNFGTGTYNTSTGVYIVSGTSAVVTSALDGLVFTPTAHQAAPGTTVTTAFTIVDSNTAGAKTTNSTATVVATAVNDAPVISGVRAAQASSDASMIKPLSAVVFSDANVGQIETVTVTLSSVANGSLSNLGSGTYSGTSGVYTVGGTSAAVTTAVNGLMFTPTAHQVAVGSTVTTSFMIVDTDAAGAKTSNGATTVVVTAAEASGAIAIGSGSDQLVLKIAEDAWQGDAQFAVSVDGIQIGGVQTAVASFAAGQSQIFTVNGAWGDGTHLASVKFLNDAYGGSSSMDRNLYVTGASYDGITQSADTLTFWSGGSQTLSVGSVAPGTTIIGSGSDVIALQVSEDYYSGNAQFTVSVDGTQIGGTQTAVASHAAGQSQTFDVAGNWGKGSHVVSVNFINDSYGGSATADRNLYVTGASYDGHASPANLAIGATGSKSITVVSSTTYNPGAAGGTVTTLGADTVKAGAGAVVVHANGPSVSLTGGTGGLTFIGGSGTDTITAGTGTVDITSNQDALTFTAGTGYAAITAGSGHAIYNIINGHAGNWLKISDFTPGLDAIHLSGYTGTGVVTDGTAAGSTYITLTDHTTIALVGVSLSGTQQIFS